MDCRSDRLTSEDYETEFCIQTLKKNHEQI